MYIYITGKTGCQYVVLLCNHRPRPSRVQRAKYNKIFVWILLKLYYRQQLIYTYYCVLSTYNKRMNDV